MTKITLSQLKEMDPCNLNKVKDIDWSKGPVGVKEAIAAGVSVADILWVAGRLAKSDEVILDKIVQFAKWCAEEAADAAANAAANAAYVAAYAAQCAVYSADAADAARCAAYVAVDAARCAAYSADAAYAARCAAYVAVDAAHYCVEVKKQKQKLIELFS